VLSDDDIIPISSRLRGRPPEPPAPVAPVHSRRRVPLTAAIGGAAFVALVTGMGIGHWQGIDRLRALPDGVRTAAYRRALSDIAETCSRPEAENGPIREHCLEQAQFLIVFPECNGDCRRLVDPILPRARR
jgi:hypothetical protein